jgi:hypothetical protein
MFHIACDLTATEPDDDAARAQGDRRHRASGESGTPRRRFQFRMSAVNQTAGE